MNDALPGVDGVLARLRQMLPKLAPHLQPETTIGDLGLDSLDTVELLCVIHEEFKVRISEGDFRPDLPLGDFAAIVTEKSNLHQKP